MELKVLFIVPSGASNTTAVMQEEGCRRFPALLATDTCPYPGYCAEIVGHLAREARLRLRPVVVTEAQLMSSSPLSGTGASQDGKNFWTSQLAMLANGSVDTLCPFQEILHHLKADFDYSLPVHRVRSVFVTHYRTDWEIEGRGRWEH